MDEPPEDAHRPIAQPLKLATLNPQGFKPDDRGRYLHVFTAIKQFEEPVLFTIVLAIRNSYRGLFIFHDIDRNKRRNREYILDKPISHVYLKISDIVKQKFADVFLGNICQQGFTLEDNDDFHFFQFNSQLSPEWIASPRYSIPQCGILDLQLWGLGLYNSWKNIPHHVGFPNSLGSFISLSRNKNSSSLQIFIYPNEFKDVFINFSCVKYIYQIKNIDDSSKKLLELFGVLPDEVRMLIFKSYIHILLSLPIKFIY
jgi:hypothetical protein